MANRIRLADTQRPLGEGAHAVVYEATDEYVDYLQRNSPYKTTAYAVKQVSMANVKLIEFLKAHIELADEGCVTPVAHYILVFLQPDGSSPKYLDSMNPLPQGMNHPPVDIQKFDRNPLQSANGKLAYMDGETGEQYYRGCVSVKTNNPLEYIRNYRSAKNFGAGSVIVTYTTPRCDTVLSALISTPRTHYVEFEANIHDRMMLLSKNRRVDKRIAGYASWYSTTFIPTPREVIELGICILRIFVAFEKHGWDHSDLHDDNIGVFVLEDGSYHVAAIDMDSVSRGKMSLVEDACDLIQLVCYGKNPSAVHTLVEHGELPELNERIYWFKKLSDFCNQDGGVTAKQAMEEWIEITSEIQF